MKTPGLTPTLRLRLEDLGAEIAYARREADLANLAAICYCEVRSWARCAGEKQVADLAWDLCIQAPPLNKVAFLGQIDRLIAELEESCMRAGIDLVAATLRSARAPSHN
ncbi:hypothetical protein QTH90_30900 [Variovorax sp. J2P1-59]|uniref:hypothetical protein n=1 Tax=Variovorax flavidus TaxID=3053501 RepID=UPI002579198F|nr:hypothetical protein [Variovorax sp. J2P1-59]MDM0078850.1 hypothetical protein [Variovorax sp. J2P1-59]